MSEKRKSKKIKTGVDVDIDNVTKWMEHEQCHYVQTSLENVKKSIDHIIKDEGEEIGKRHVFLIICPEELE